MARGLTASAAAATAATATPAAAAAAARRAVVFTGTRLVDRQGAALNFLARQRRNGGLGRFRRAHGDKSEAARTSAHAVGDEVDLRHGTVRGEEVLEVIFCGIEGKVSHVQFRIHFSISHYKIACSFPELFPEIGFQIITETCSPEDSPCWKFDNAIYSWLQNALLAARLQVFFAKYSFLAKKTRFKGDFRAPTPQKKETRLAQPNTKRVYIPSNNAIVLHEPIMVAIGISLKSHIRETRKTSRHLPRHRFSNSPHPPRRRETPSAALGRLRTTRFWSRSR